MSTLRVDIDPKLQSGIAQRVQEEFVVDRRSEDIHPVVPTLDDVVRESWDKEATAASHVPAGRKGGAPPGVRKASDF